MRLFWIAFCLVLISLVGYAYAKDPDGCWKIIDDFGALLANISPVKVEFKNGAATIAANNLTNAAPAEAAAPTPVVTSVPHVTDPNAPSPTPANATAGSVTKAAPTILNSSPASANAAPAVTNAAPLSLNSAPLSLNSAPPVTNVAPVSAMTAPAPTNSAPPAQ